PFQPFLHAGIKRPAHDDPPSIRGATLERVAMQASRRQTESLDHFLRRFANQIAEAIELFRLVSRVNTGSSRRQARRRTGFLKARIGSTACPVTAGCSANC